LFRIQRKSGALYKSIAACDITACDLANLLKFMNRISRAIAVILIVLGCIISVLVQPPQSALTVPPPVQESPRRGGDVAETINFGTALSRARS
jgi:hypothetical protein